MKWSNGNYRLFEPRDETGIAASMLCQKLILFDGILLDLIFLENNKTTKTKTGKRDLLIKSDEVTFEFTKLWNRNIQKDEEVAEKKNP
jgi:hypothetical protein